MWNLIFIFSITFSFNLLGDQAIVSKVKGSSNKSEKIIHVEKELKSLIKKQKDLQRDFKKTKNEKLLDQALDLTTAIVSLQQVLELIREYPSCNDSLFMYKRNYRHSKSDSFADPVLQEGYEILQSMCKKEE